MYVTGWIKRGATGGIGRNRMCGEETAEAVIADFIDEKLTDPTVSRDDVEQLIVGRGAHLIDLDGWKHIDAAEKAAGAMRAVRGSSSPDISSLEAAADSAE